MRNTTDIIIPIYNQEKYLRRCLDSFLPYVDDSFTTLLVNDGSSDGSLEICKEYQNKYSNIKIIDKANGGAASARNAGLNESKSDYVVFIDPDDCVSDGYIDWIKTNAKYDDKIIVCSYVIKHKDFGEQKIALNSQISVFNDALTELEKTGLFNSVCNKIYSRKKIENEPELRFNINSEPGEDLLFNCEYFTRIKQIELTEKPYYCYMRNGEDSLANKFRKDLWSKNKIFIEAIEKMYETLCLSNEESVKSLSTAVIRYVHSAIPNMYRKKNKFKKTERLSFYKEIIETRKYNYYFDNLETDEPLLNQLKKIYLKGSAKKMDSFYSFLMFIRNNLSKIYILLRKLKTK